MDAIVECREVLVWVGIGFEFPVDLWPIQHQRYELCQTFVEGLSMEGLLFRRWTSASFLQGEGVFGFVQLQRLLRFA